jgi:hypothetical protein
MERTVRRIGQIEPKDDPQDENQVPADSGLMDAIILTMIEFVLAVPMLFAIFYGFQLFLGTAELAGVVDHYVATAPALKSKELLFNGVPTFGNITNVHVGVVSTDGVTVGGTPFHSFTNAPFNGATSLKWAIVQGQANINYPLLPLGATLSVLDVEDITGANRVASASPLAGITAQDPSTLPSAVNPNRQGTP